MARLKNRVVSLGFIEKGTGKHMSNSVYSRFGISPCVMASLGIKQLCARYYKGLEADNSNAVLVEFYE